jgi:hypothetical protein
MNTSEKEQFTDLIINIFEIYSMKITPASIMIWSNLMNGYPFSSVKEAIRLGRITEEHGKKMLPHITNWTELMRLS